jgi:hypothetical protein
MHRKTACDAGMHVHAQAAGVGRTHSHACWRLHAGRTDSRACEQASTCARTPHRRQGKRDKAGAGFFVSSTKGRDIVAPSMRTTAGFRISDGQGSCWTGQGWSMGSGGCLQQEGEERVDKVASASRCKVSSAW